MKKLILTSVIILALIFTVSAQVFTEDAQVLTTVSVSRTAKNNNGDNLHKVANVFSAKVGDELKRLYPAEYSWPEVNLECSPAGYITLSYMVEIVRSDSANAKTVFDHRGALSISKYDNARKISKENLDSACVSFRAKGYEVLSIGSGFDSKVVCNGITYHVSEGFIGANKK
ncbi:MAG: hypothetical protein PF542_05565 [Nanoarchaeota archaeon]|jgi:hypothetical protein|nr:hypothetical protein [Nanoarchaeota archaeon]